MTAGIPGAGIGGLFYLLSALAMPFREMWNALHGQSTAASRALVKRQTAMAAAILSSMWGTAWLLSETIRYSRTIVFFNSATTTASAQSAPELPMLLSYSALAYSLATLAAIWISVHLLRFIVMPAQLRLKRTPRVAMSLGRVTFLVLALLISAEAAHGLQAEDNEEIKSLLEKAEAAYDSGDSVLSVQSFRAVLSVDVENSRATFRLAQLLEPREPSESEGLYERYIALEPDDAWGYMALGDFLARQERYDRALELYSNAVRLAPNERDSVVGQARVLGRSGRTDQAISAYENWLAAHQEDAEAWRDLARERNRAGRPRGARTAFDRAASVDEGQANEEQMEYYRGAAAPTVEPMLLFSGDSDGNFRRKVQAGGDIAVSDTARLGVSAGHTNISDDFDDRNYAEFAVKVRMRPRAAFQLDAAAGAVRIDAGKHPVTGAQSDAKFIGTAQVRARATAPGNKGRFDAQFQRTLLDSTPLLVANQIIRNELRFRPEVSVTRQLRLRGVAGGAWIRGGGEKNTRSIAGGGVGWGITPAMEVNANYAQIRYTNSSRAGYFAPDKIHALDFGSYMEFEGDATLVALDFGAGAERIKEHGAVFGSWSPALRAYVLVSYRFHTGSEFRLEVEGYDTQAAAIAATSSGWRYGSAAVTFRLAIP